MSQIIDWGSPSTGKTAEGHARPRPVLLGTLSVRIDACAERMAIDSALEAGAKLILANMLLLPPYPRTVMLAPEYATLPHEEDLDEVRATASSAVALGIETELLRVSSPRPVRALIELAASARWACWCSARTAPGFRATGSGGRRGPCASTRRASSGPLSPSRSSAGCARSRSGPCRTAAVHPRRARDARPHRSTARGRRRGGRRRRDRPDGRARPPATAAPRAT